MSDMTPDFSPIMGTTPIRGFYLDAGWGTWGFKATPVCGTTMAYTLAKDQDHELIRPFNLRGSRITSSSARKAPPRWDTESANPHPGEERACGRFLNGTRSRVNGDKRAD